MMSIIFGDLNAYRHRRACIKFNWRVFNLAIYTEFAKLKTSPMFPAIQYGSKPKQFTVQQTRVMATRSLPIQVSLYGTTSSEYTTELGIRKLMGIISNSHFLLEESTNIGLVNFALGALVESEIAHDLLNARTMGKKDLEISISSLKTLASSFKNAKEGY